MMDHQTEMLRDRLRRAAGTLPDAAHVTLSVRDVLACLALIEASEELDEIEDMRGEMEELREQVRSLTEELAQIDLERDAA
jgi:hypothetical protein